MQRRIFLAATAAIVGWHSSLAFSESSERRIEDRCFTAHCDGSEQRYAVLYPQNFVPNMPYDLLITLHGHGSDRNQFIMDDRDECRAAREFAATRQMLMVSPDYRAKTSWMGPKAEADLLQLLELLRTEFSIRRTIVAGGSMGGSSALTFAALHPDQLDAVVAMNGTANHLEYDQFQDAIAESFGGSKQEIPSEYKLRSAEYFPERLTMPIAVTTGGKDTVVPAASVTRLAQILQILQRPILHFHQPDGGH
ncbi:MAG: alpha/beta fold hydrolase, partial [Thermoguttaceae bacterium]|nr:alpha/beta fold hydrolase [Thermoguttaceae bacterium]